MFSISTIKNTVAIGLLLILLCIPVVLPEKSFEIDNVEEAVDIELEYINYQDLYTKIAHIESRQNYDVANKTRTVGK